VNAYNFAGAKVTARVFFNDEPRGEPQDFTLRPEKGNELKLT
jgi:hypothetical protein